MTAFEPPNEFEKFAEARRLDANGLLWQVPGLSITAQSFLVAAALDEGTARGLRTGVAALAAVLAMATIQILLRHRYRAALFSNAIDASREIRGALPVDTPDLFEQIAEDRETAQGKAFTEFQGPSWHPQRWPAYRTWIVVLLSFVAMDIAIAVSAASSG